MNARLLLVFLALVLTACGSAPLAEPPIYPDAQLQRRGRLGVLMPETEDGTQGLPRAQGGLWSLSNYSAIARAGGLRPG